MLFGYVRVSTREQAQGVSLEEQERKIRGVAMMRGEPDPLIFRDEGVSGSLLLSDRPQGAALLAQIQPHDFLAGSKLDRLFRNAEDALVTARQLKERHIGLILTDIGNEPVTENGTAKLLFGILAQVAEFERERILERIREGMDGKRRQGGFMGGLAPYGYRIEGRGRGSRLVSISEEQEIIAFVREKREVRGESLGAISRALERLGHVSRNGKPFAPQQLLRMIDAVKPVDKTAV
jgi:DNA invertase Pin-like site-specific DNA recombinase